jgi:signal transduction histidine kinase/ActR/RegA family two-component response regulator
VKELRDAAAAHPEGMLESRTVAGGTVLAAFSRTPTYGWTLAIGVPQAQVGSAEAAAAAVGGFAFVVLLLSLWAATHLGRRLVQPVDQIRDAAERLAAGERLEMHSTGLAETDTVQRVLVDTSERIASTSEEMKRRVHEALAEAEKAHQAVLQNQRLEALGQLTGGVAHDFNNLLMVVSNYAFLLKAKFPELADSREIAGIERSVSTGSKLTRQLLAFARRQAVRPEALQLHTRLPEIAELMKASVGSNIRLECHVAEESLVIVADPAEFELALINLAVNARDAMPEGGKLRITAERSGDDRVAIAVADTGTGIPPEVLARVFEPFFTTKALGHGTGLGLSQVYGFATQAGGEARIASQPGEGTTVTLLLPLAHAHAVADPEKDDASPAQGRGEHVLMVEDNAELGGVAEQVLGRAHYRVTRATTADEALALLREQDFDLVLTDVRMPGERDGIALAEWIVAHRPGLPVILTTGYSEHLARAQSLQLPVMPKPTRPDVLLAEVRRQLDARARAAMAEATSIGPR